MLKTHLKLVHISHHTALCSSVLWGYSKRTREKRDQSQQNTDVKIVKKYSGSLQQAVQSMLADSKLLVRTAKQMTWFHRVCFYTKSNQLMFAENIL